MNDDLNKRLRFLLETKGVTFAAAADHLGIPKDHFMGIVDGIINPTPRQIQKLAALCNVSIEYLIGGSDPEVADDEKSGGPRKPLTLELLAVRFQALCECLVDAEILTAADIKQKTEEVEMRAAARLREKSLADAKAKRQGGRGRVKA